MSLVEIESTRIRDSDDDSGRPQLSEKALGLLEAARRVLDRDGADGLTLRAIANEGKVPTSLAMYYFGSMAKLEALLLDSIWRDEVAQHLETLQTLPSSFEDRVDILVNFHSNIAGKLDGFQAYCELITHVIRNPSTKQAVARIYEGYRSELNYPFLVTSEHPSSRTRANSAVMLAAGEGLPIGRLLGLSEPSMLDGFEMLSAIFKQEILNESPTETPTPPAQLEPTQAVSTDLRAGHGAYKSSNRLLSAGRRLLHKGGLRELTFGRIAVESGESKSLISYHFKSKKGFINALVKSLLEEWLESINRTLIDPKLISPALLARELFSENSPFVTLILLQPVLRRDSELQGIARTTYLQAVTLLSGRMNFSTSEHRNCSELTAAAVFLAVLNEEPHINMPAKHHR